MQVQTHTHALMDEKVCEFLLNCLSGGSVCIWVAFNLSYNSVVIVGVFPVTLMHITWYLVKNFNEINVNCRNRRNIIIKKPFPLETFDYRMNDLAQNVLQELS